MADFPPGGFLRFEAQMRTVFALVAGVAAYFILRPFTSVPTCIVAGWDAFAATLLALIWIAILSSGVEHIRHRARTEDLSRYLVFVLTVAAACCSVFAVIVLLSAAKKTTHLGFHAAVSVIAVLASWTLVHSMFGLRYAHFYYGEGDSSEKPAGGLEFPGDDAPDYLDFAYFSFVIGMTCQVSDVQITAQRLRTLALIHGVLSFCFNTVILALTINTISGLL